MLRKFQASLAFACFFSVILLVIWWGTLPALAAVEGQWDWPPFTIPYTNLPTNWIYSLKTTALGDVWCGSGYGAPGATLGGASKYVGDVWRNRPEHPDWETYNSTNEDLTKRLPDNWIYSIDFDFSGHVWVASPRGVSEIRNTSPYVHTELLGEPIRCVAVSPTGEVWAAMMQHFGHNAALYRGVWNNSTRQWNWTWYNSTNVPQYTSWNINTLAFDLQGNLWVGTNDDGARKFDLATTTWSDYTVSNSSIPSNRINAIAFDQFGNVWFGTSKIGPTGGGAARFDPVSKSWETYYNPKNEQQLQDWDVMSITIAPDEAGIWFGTLHGAYLFDETRPPEFQWRVFNSSNTQARLPDNSIADIEYDQAGYIWFATKSNGIGRVKASSVIPVDPSMQVKITSPADKSMVYGIVDVQATAYSNLGIAKVNFYVDGVLKATSNNAPYSFSWDTTSYALGIHTIRAVAYNTEGVRGSDIVQVIVSKRTPTKTWFTWYDWASPGMNGDWVLVCNPGTDPIFVTIFIGREHMGTYEIAPGEMITPTYQGTIDGPVLVSSTGPALTSQRVVCNDSFNEVYGLDNSNLSDEILFTWYDWASPGMDGNWILVGNPSTADTASVNIYVGGDLKGTYSIPPGERVTPSYKGTIGGPVRVISTNGVPIFASQRVICHSTFNEVYGLTKSDLSNEIFFTWYDWASPGMDGNWVLVGNPSDAATADVKIYIGGSLKGEYSIPPGGQITPSYPGTIGGPVRIVSTVPVFASQRVVCQSSFNEVYGITNLDLSDEVLFTWYDWASPGMNGNWVLVGNPSTANTADVKIYIAGDLKGTYSIPPGGQITPSYPGTIGGPVRVISTNGVPIFASQRVICHSSFNEVFGVSF